MNLVLLLISCMGHAAGVEALAVETQEIPILPPPPTATATPTLRPTATATPTPAPSADRVTDAQLVFKRVLAAQDAMLSMRCEIVRSQSGTGMAPLEMSGILMVKNPGMARLEITQPAGQKAVSDGRFLWVEMPEVKQVMQYDAASLRENGNFFLDLGSSLRHFGQGSSKKLAAPGADFDLHRVAALDLKPARPASAGFTRMRIWVDLLEWNVLQVQLTQEGVENRIRFRNITAVTRAEADSRTRAPLEDALFQYRPPRDFQVFDMRTMP